MISASEGFQLLSEKRLDYEDLEDHTISAIWRYWRKQRRGTRPPRRADIDPADLRNQLGRIHILDIEAPGIYRYRLCGSEVTNPDRRDMTGRTTMDYDDKAFGEMVTRHLSTALAERRPVCFEIEATARGLPYTYIRGVFPLADAEGGIEKLLVGTHRRSVPREFHR